jgi:D-alanine-D-alanine ligase
MKVVLLHTLDALEPPPVDPVIGQLTDTLTGLGHDASTVVVDRGGDVAATVERLRQQKPDLVFNIAESFAGKSALESNVAGLLNLLDLRYTGSSPARASRRRCCSRTRSRRHGRRPCSAARSILPAI